MFIGRKEELAFLEESYASKEGQLIVLYGRRRVGKTETLHKFCEGKEHVFYSCTESPDGQQLQAFSERILSKDTPAAKFLSTFQDWESALESICQLNCDGKKLLVIDEFPYMVKGNSVIPSILQNLWDNKLKRENVMIILCGSAMAFMEKEVLSEKNPLYGRATGILKMKELNFYEAIQFFPQYSPLDQITAYGILGGIPHYLKQFDDQRSLAENIKKNILTRGSILYSEVEFLMRQELRETAVYNAIIEAVALGNTKMNDLFQKTKIEKSKLSVYLKNLTDLGVIQREFPVSEGLKAQANIQRGLYQVADHYFRFWYAFVFPNLSELENGDVEGVWKYVVEPSLDQYTSHVFENVCREYLRRENRKNALPFRFSKIGRWWLKDKELDVMATNWDHSAFLLGECKYKNRPFNLNELTAMREKFVPQKKDAKVYYYLFSRSGFTDEVRNVAKGDGIATVGVDELLADD